MQTKKYHVSKGDTVMVITGKEKTKTGKILRVIPKKDTIIVEGLNFVKRHMRSRGNEPGGIIEKESALHVSNVQLYCTKCVKPVRTRVKILENGDKQRTCVKCGISLEN
jgi:large subunit ribosomal protein L24